MCRKSNFVFFAHGNNGNGVLLRFSGFRLCGKLFSPKINYRTRAIITCSWFETALYQKFCILSLRNKLLFKTKVTKVYSKILFMKSSESNFIFLPAFYLINWVMKALKNFGKITILKILELIFLGGVKIHFGKLALKWCIFRHEKKIFWTNIIP